MKYILTIFKEHKYQLLLIYFYLFIAQSLILLEPYVLGKMIDGLLNKQYMWMFTFLGIVLIENILIFRRMVYDTKIYTKIYNNIVLKYLKREKHSNHSSRIARTELSNNIINFLESDVHFYIYAILTVMGSLAFIFMNSVITGLIVIASIAPICTIVYFLYKKIAQSTKITHDHYEQKIEILSDNNDVKVETFFKRRRKILIYGSTLQGKNWTALNSVKSIFLVIALVVFTHNSKISQGETVSMYAYINQFLISLMSIPIGIETFTRMKDVIGRIKN
jgi:ABC-type bacteriocin/lantibiotic exporter with double-glycine peptidase domain